MTEDRKFFSRKSESVEAFSNQWVLRRLLHQRMVFLHQTNLDQCGLLEHRLVRVLVADKTVKLKRSITTMIPETPIKLG